MSEEAWIDLHNPHYNVTCSDTGANCAGSLVLLDTSGAPADLSWWPEINVDQADPARQCVKYKDDGGGKLEGEELKKLYTDRQMEPAMSDETWKPDSDVGL